MAKQFNESALLEKEHGVIRAQKIRRRLAELRAAQCLQDFWPPKSGPSRCHELTKGERKGQLSMDLDHPYRLIFVPQQISLKEDGGLNWRQVTAVTILGVENTHE